MRHDHVQRVGRAALEEADENLPARRAARSSRRERRAPQEGRAQAQRHERERAGLHEDSSLHGPMGIGVLAPLEFGRAEREPDDLRFKPVEVARSASKRDRGALRGPSAPCRRRSIDMDVSRSPAPFSIGFTPASRISRVSDARLPAEQPAMTPSTCARAARRGAPRSGPALGTRTGKGASSERPARS